MLKIVGLWPLDNKNAREVLLSKFGLMFNVITLIFILTIPALASLRRVWGDMILVIDNLQYTLPLVITVLKVSIMWCNKEGTYTSQLTLFSLFYMFALVELNLYTYMYRSVI